MTSILLDTNVLAYAFDANAPDKQGQALAVLDHLQPGGQACVSAQNLAEFCHIATRKLHPPLTPAQTYQVVERFSRSFQVFDLTPAIVLEATRGVRDHQLAYYDAQVWAAARLNQVPVIFSEDFATGAILEGVRFINPFAKDFTLETWGL